jgi:hypothetical protein
METKQKVAIAGAGLMAAGVGLSIIGAALTIPAMLAWVVDLAEKRTMGLSAKVEGASKTVGTVAGTLHRSFKEATRAGMAEIKRARTAD